MQLGSRAVDAVADVINGLVGGGRLRLMGGTPPADADAASDRPWLVDIPLGMPAFSAPTDGEMDLLPTDSAKAVKGGRITWFCVANAAGRCVLMGSANTSDADLLLTRRMVTMGDTVTIDAFRYVVPRS